MKKQNFSHRFLAVLLSLALLITTLPLGMGTAFAQEVADDNGFLFEGTVLTGVENQWDFLDSDLQLPAQTPDGKTVTAIGKGAFESLGETGVEYAVTIPEGIQSIGDEAFYNVPLTSVSLPSTLTTLGWRCLANTDLPAVTLPAGLKTIDAQALRDNELTSVALPEGLTVIKGSAFKNNNLTAVTLPEGLKELWLDAFTNNDITQVAIPGGLSHFDAAFAGNPLEQVTLGEGLTKLPENAFASVDYKLGKLKAIDLPASLEEIGAKAFYNQPIQSLVLPKNLKSIGREAFAKKSDRAADADRMTSLTFNDALEYIGSGAFKNNALSGKLEFPASLQGIGAYAVSNLINYPGAFENNKLTNVTFPEGLTIIGNNSFANNELAGTLVLPQSIERVGSHAFYKNHITDIYAPPLDDLEDGTERVGEDPYSMNGVNGDEDIIPKNDPAPVVGADWGKKDFTVVYGTYDTGSGHLEGAVVEGFSNAGKEKVKKNGNVVIPADLMKDYKVIAIGKDAFKDQPIASVTLPDSLVEVRDGAFRHTSFDEKVPKLTKVVLPAKVQAVGNGAFANNRIAKLTLPEGLKAIGPNAFSYNRLQAVRIPNSVTDIGAWAFKDNVIPQDAAEIDNYKGAVAIGMEAFDHNGAQSDTSITPKYLRTKDEAPNTWPAAYFTWDGQTVTGFSDEGLAYLKDHSALVLPAETPDGKPVTAVGKMAFALIDTKHKGCELTSVVLPDTITSLGMAAFFRNRIKGELVIPASITEIPLSVFRGNELTNVIFKGPVKNIGLYAFAENCLTEVAIPASVTEIHPTAFAANFGVPEYSDHVVLWTPQKNNPNKLPDSDYHYVDPSDDKKVDVPPMDYDTWVQDDFTWDGQTVTGFSKQGERKTQKNKHLVIPDTTPAGQPVLAVGDSAFRGFMKTFKYHLQSVVVPDSVETIGAYAFQFNDLTEIHLPRNLKEAGYGIVMSNKLTSIEIPEGLQKLDMLFCKDNRLESIKIPAGVTTICAEAFGNNELRTVTFADGSRLDRIDHNAFAENNLTEVNIPASVSAIEYKAFESNPGNDQYGKENIEGVHVNPVVLHTPDGHNPKALADDLFHSFVVDPTLKGDKSQLEAALARAKALLENEADKHNEDYLTGLRNEVALAQSVIDDENASLGAIRLAVNTLNWRLSRAELDAAVKEALSYDTDEYTEDSRKPLKDAIKKGKRDRNVINVTDKVIQGDIDNLKSAMALMVRKGEAPHYTMKKGEHPVFIKHYGSVTDYIAKLAFAVSNDNGRVLHVVDDGTGKALLADHDTAEHDWPYWRDALQGMSRLLFNKTAEDIAALSNEDIAKATHFDAVSGATVAGSAIREAALQALGYGEKVTVTFDSDGGSAVAPIQVTKGQPIDKPQDPSRDGYQFAGWFLDKGAYRFGTPVNENITLVAQWNKKKPAEPGTSSGGSSSGSSSSSSSSKNKSDSVSKDKKNDVDSTKGDKTKPADDVAQATHKGYLGGYQDGGVHPDSLITRAELAALLNRLADLPPVEATGDHWAAADIAAVKAAGIMRGYENGDFGPDRYVTRAELTATLVRVLNLSPASGGSFSDIAGHWAEGDLVAAANADLIRGYPDGTMRPDQSVTRAEAVAMLNRAFDISAESLPDASPWNDIDESHWAYREFIAAKK